MCLVLIAAEGASAPCADFKTAHKGAQQPFSVRISILVSGRFRNAVSRSAEVLKE
jgi:hypothetical protein